MKFAEAVSETAEQYVDEAENEGGDALVADPGLMRQVLEDFALYLKCTKDADVHDELTPSRRGDERLHVLTEEQFITVFDIVNDWNVLMNGFHDHDFDEPKELEDTRAMQEAAVKWLKQAVEDRGGNAEGD